MGFINQPTSLGFWATTLYIVGVETRRTMWQLDKIPFLHVSMICLLKMWVFHGLAESHSLSNGFPVDLARAQCLLSLKSLQSPWALAPQWTCQCPLGDHTIILDGPAGLTWTDITWILSIGNPVENPVHTWYYMMIFDSCPKLWGCETSLESKSRLRGKFQKKGRAEWVTDIPGVHPNEAVVENDSEAALLVHQRFPMERVDRTVVQDCQLILEWDARMKTEVLGLCTKDAQRMSENRGAIHSHIFLGPIQTARVCSNSSHFQTNTHTQTHTHCLGFLFDDDECRTCRRLIF